MPARLPSLRRRIPAVPAEPTDPELLPVVPDLVAPPPLRMPRAAVRWIVPAVLLGGGAATAMAWWLLSGLPRLPKVAEEATARQGAIQTSLALAAGIGAAVTLMLAFRRQRHQEHAAHVTTYLAERNARLAEQVAEHNRQDAIERRVTELYTKAVEQLGHTGAAVRLGGLYSLERLAQGNSEHRQTIVNVICAYLRMPYVPPGVTTPGTAPPGPWAAPTGDGQGEQQVRLTAQRILAEHLRDDRSSRRHETAVVGSRFWEGMRIDLTGATLIDLDLAHCHLNDARFDEVTFQGDAGFNGAVFHGDAGFRGATCTGSADFAEATFQGKVRLSEGTFGETRFTRATFHETADLRETRFTGDAVFTEVTFHGGADFRRSAFAEDAGFTEAAFHRETRFDRVAFAGDVRFTKAVFHGVTWFTWAAFHGDRGAWLNDVTFHGGVDFREVVFTGDVWFDRTVFHGVVGFIKAVFHQAAGFGEVGFGLSVGFEDAVFAGFAVFDRTIFHGRAAFTRVTLTEDTRFDDVQVMQSGGHYVWPTGWTVVPRSDGSGTLRRDDAESSDEDPSV
ncbi:pentapeptide repeat-containing protein [Streptosporangium saharense]|uniref:pentapeptide repeat-containing protein n=1 Tax=Streptosporangium saharense TaxID=1706840 RepID=UPI0033292A46